LKNWVFQIHWFLGITAGLVLAVVGGTGALMSFERQIMEAISPGVASVSERPAGAIPLTPDELLARFRADRPGAWIEQITLSSAPERNVSIRVANADRTKRSQSIYVDAYTGETLGSLNGQKFFRTVLELHRWLLVPTGEGLNIGRQITGFSAIALVYFALSGLYLRWPRRPLNWRSWFRIDFSLSGRNFYWALHSVIGTWVLIVYLLLSLTGLYWSYSWYRSGLSIILTGEPVEERRGGRGGRNGGGNEELPESPPLVAAAWQGFLTKTDNHYKTAAITIPKKDGDAFTINYVLPEALHDRQRNSLSITPEGDIVTHKPYVRIEHLGKRIYQGIYELHVGDWFGTTGRVVNMIASLLMPLFTITGFLLYFDRRKKKRNTKLAAAATNALVTRDNNSPNDLTADYLIVYASQSGTAEQLAWHTAGVFHSAGVSAAVVSMADLKLESIQAAEKVLFLLSTFGEGEPPDIARTFIKKYLKLSPDLQQLQFGLLALGDKRYSDFCAFAVSVEAWLLENGANEIFTRIEVDNGDEHSLQQWQVEIAKLSGATDITAWAAPEFEEWQLHSRQLLNQGSVGDAIYQVNLSPPNAASGTWQAGDILVIHPQHDAARVDTFLRENNLNGETIIKDAPLSNWLAKSIFPTTPLKEQALQTWVESLEPLPHREYSIASIPNDGEVQLVIRQVFNEHGQLGLGSGWLTQFAREHQIVLARVRSNPTFHAPQAFHAPEESCPMILIGAGTGIAGLRSHLRARWLAGEKTNWLIFGERNRANDRLFGDELDAMADAGFITQFDAIFSRDNEGYVQDRLLQEQEKLRDWIVDGAAIYVCGSLVGMGAGVESALLEIFGENKLQSLRESGHYRRDIY